MTRHADRIIAGVTVLALVLLVGLSTGGGRLVAQVGTAVKNGFTVCQGANCDNVFVIGGTWKIGSTLVGSTAAEIDRVADQSTFAAIAATGDTLTATQATHAGKVVGFGKTTGTTVTLPAATGTGDVYTFVIAIAATSNSNIVKVANATDVMNGSVNLQQDVDSAGTLKMWQAAVGDDTISLAGAATTGGIKGNVVRCTDYLSGFWSCQVYTSSGGGAEATPFSATVS